MWLNNNIHILMTKGDFIFASWKKGADKQYRRKVHELRCAGYRKIGVEHDSLNMYEHYRRKGKKKIITITIMCS